MSHRQVPGIGRASVHGIAIGIGEVVAACALVLLFDLLGPTPSGYAGAALGQALALLLPFLLGGAALAGYLAGGIAAGYVRSYRLWLAITASAPMLCAALAFAYLAHEGR
ncbi:hypothetical protein [Pseudoduganella chitinolytica]|uniref:Major facilitator superfamily (MFS) profile domain-containing protein n=1 Tax=Pseudoduganella chitinolytica TaxID=34070 RepID=A0ABY8BJZ6_9BURK|nr:hypothetical protein [Pseudoduganella chitinolytica]WEF35733.1 hypothetical protein PX653_13595 [Pseudoduganella chitinolytica]